jgi:hypothetical protein
VTASSSSCIVGPRSSALLCKSRSQQPTGEFLRKALGYFAADLK